ncbi:MAG: NADH-quinone oxidoreductase subunit NuoE [Clostridiales bacterium]
MSCEKKCCSEEKQLDFSQLDKVLTQYCGTAGSLITILQNAQEIYGYLPREVIERIADKVDLKPARIYGVATFYTQFRFSPVGKYLILLCQGTACHVNGAKMIAEAVYEELGIQNGETTADGLFTLNNVACLGCCSLSPVMMINGETYGSLTKDKVKAIFDSYKHQA